MKVLCVGEMLVDIVATSIKDVLFQNDTHLIDHIKIMCGGDANNNAINLAKLGSEVTYLGRIGCDAMGDYVLNCARQANINMDHTVRSTTAPQAKSLILINESADRTFFQCVGTSAEFCFEDCDLSLLESVDLLQVGGAFHLPSFDGIGTAKLFEAAKRHNVITSMDVTSDRSNRWKGILDPAYPYLDYFLPSIEQASMMAESEKPSEIANFFLTKGVKNVAIKLGSRGVYFKNKETAFYAGTYDNLHIVDTTGAGDAFCAGFLTGVGMGYSPEKCVTLGTACSAFAIQEVGATAGMKDLQTIFDFIDSRPPLKLEVEY